MDTASNIDALYDTRDVTDLSTLDPEPFGFSTIFLSTEQYLVIYDELIMNFILALVAVAVLSVFVLGNIAIVALICFTVVRRCCVRPAVCPRFSHMLILIWSNASILLFTAGAFVVAAIVTVRPEASLECWYCWSWQDTAIVSAAAVNILRPCTQTAPWQLKQAGGVCFIVAPKLRPGV